jgi:molybdopterin converting factor small subunit
VTLALKKMQQIASEEVMLPPTCLVIVNGRHLGTVASCESCVLRAGDELTLLAPVAGG